MLYTGPTLPLYLVCIIRSSNPGYEIRLVKGPVGFLCGVKKNTIISNCIYMYNVHTCDW